MKVSRIEIKDVNQFKDLDIDLTYPKGHAKEGQPLEKVCFIGQSGTGKTTLLKFIYGLSDSSKILDNYNLQIPIDRIAATLNIGNIKIKNSLYYHHVAKNLWPQLVIITDDIEKTISNTEFSNLKDESGSKLIFFPADMRYETQSTPENGFDINLKTFDFSEESIKTTWNILRTLIKSVQEQELVLTQKIANIASENIVNTKELQETIDELKLLRTSKSNSILNIAQNCLDPILNHFNLKVKTELDIQTKEDIGLLKIIDNQGRIIADNFLSSGAQQVILSALPLYLLKPTQTIILFDEPESSLYPDMQKLIVDYYTSFTKDSQFFFATHSPIIASCFDPWEIVELKFDKEGYVVQEQYYEGERHVDNYSINPKYLTYDLMLSKMFDVDEPSNAERNYKITEFLSHKGRLDLLKKDGKTKDPEYRQIFDEYMSIGKKLFWDTNMAV